MEPIKIKRNDTAKAIEFVPNDQTIDYTGASAVFHMRASDGSLKVEDGAATIVTGGTEDYFQFAPQAADVDASGDYEGEFEITFSDGKIGTFPDDGYMLIRVGDDLS